MSNQKISSATKQVRQSRHRAPTRHGRRGPVIQEFPEVQHCRTCIASKSLVNFPQATTNLQGVATVRISSSTSLVAGRRGPHWDADDLRSGSRPEQRYVLARSQSLQNLQGSKIRAVRRRQVASCLMRFPTASATLCRATVSACRSTIGKDQDVLHNERRRPDERLYGQHLQLPQIRRIPPDGDLALYDCRARTAHYGAYAQCDGGICFNSTEGQSFPGFDKPLMAKDQIICSCPITVTNPDTAKLGYQIIGPYPCQEHRSSRTAPAPPPNRKPARRSMWVLPPGRRRS